MTAVAMLLASALAGCSSAAAETRKVDPRQGYDPAKIRTQIAAVEADNESLNRLFTILNQRLFDEFDKDRSIAQAQARLRKLLELRSPEAAADSALQAVIESRRTFHLADGATAAEAEQWLQADFDVWQASTFGKAEYRRSGTAPAQLVEMIRDPRAQYPDPLRYLVFIDGQRVNLPPLGPANEDSAVSTRHDGLTVELACTSWVSLIGRGWCNLAIDATTVTSSRY